MLPGRFNRRLLLIAAPLILALVGLAVTGVWAGKNFLNRPEPHIPAKTPQKAFRIVYRIEDASGSSTAVKTEVLEVVRPYNARADLRAGTSSQGRVESGRISNREYLWNLDRSGNVTVAFRRAPDGAIRQASATSLHDAVLAGLAEPRGLETRVGRRCNVFAFARPAPQPLAAPTRDEFVEICLTPDGMVLSESWVFRGRKARASSAVSISLAESEPLRFFVGQEPPTTEAGRLLGGSVVVQDDATPPVVAAEFNPPSGFLLDRKAIVSYQSGQDRGRQSLVETYLSDDVLAVVERATVAGGSVPWEPSQGKGIEAGPLGKGRIVYFVDRVEVRFTGDWGFARVSAPSRELALRLAGRLSAASPSN